MSRTPKAPLNYHRALSYAFAAAGLFLGGCVNTSVTSSKSTSEQERVERVVFVIQSGTFASPNIAANLGQKNLDGLIPNLNARLPIVFALNGLPARVTQISGSLGQNLNVVKLQTGERLILLSPVSATYNSRSGQSLTIRAELYAPARPIVTWRAEVRMATMGFGKFDEKVADSVATQMLERLRADGIAQLLDGVFRTE
jgi:hypothetical protein